jgi:hypothetical protein
VIDPNATTQRMSQSPKPENREGSGVITARLPIIRGQSPRPMPSRPCRFIRRLLGIVPKNPKV